MFLFTYVFSIFLHKIKMCFWNKDNCMSSTHQFQKPNFLFAIGYRNNKDTGPNHSFLWENPWQKAFRQEHTERFLLQIFFFFLINASLRMGKCFFSTDLRNPGNLWGSHQHGCPAPGCLQDCKPSQLTVQASAQRPCWWSLLPPFPHKRTKTSRKEGQTGNRLANSAASGCIQHLTRASRKQGSGHEHSSHLLLWWPPPQVILSYESREC